MYNALGQRVEDYQGTASTSMKLYYPRDIFGDRTGIWDDHSSVGWVGWDVYWARVAGQRLNMGGASAYIDHADAVGSTTMETDPAGGVQWDMTHYPWGQIWQQGGTRQTGVYAGLDWQVNDPLLPSATRELSPALGRWMTPDPAGLAATDPANPQSWNRYAYVMNNPTTYSDPLGLIGPNDCYSTAPCTITVSGGETGLTPAVELLLDGVMVVPNILLYPSLPQPYAGPLSVAPSNGPSSKQTKCAEQALKKNAVALSFDATGIGAGFVPGGDAAVAIAQSTVSFGSGIYSGFHHDTTGEALSLTAYGTSILTPIAKAMGGDIAKAVPGLGAFISVVSFAHDVQNLYEDYGSCMAGVQ